MHKINGGQLHYAQQKQNEEFVENTKQVTNGNIVI